MMTSTGSAFRRALLHSFNHLDAGCSGGSYALALLQSFGGVNKQHATRQQVFSLPLPARLSLAVSWEDPLVYFGNLLRLVVVARTGPKIRDISIWDNPAIRCRALGMQGAEGKTERTRLSCRLGEERWRMT